MSDEIANPKSVFIAYRRSVSAGWARAVFYDLRQHGFDVFMDVESIDSGTFESIILPQIEARAHFIVLLAPGSLERFDEPDDWLRREIEHAIDTGRNIVSLLLSSFRFSPETEPYLTGKLAALTRYPALPLPHDYFDEAMQRLRSRFLRVSLLIPATTETDAPEAQAIIAQVKALGKPEENVLEAERLVIRGNEHVRFGEFDSAKRYYAQALHLNPELPEGYRKRAEMLAEAGQYDAAIENYRLYGRLMESALEQRISELEQKAAVG